MVTVNYTTTGDVWFTRLPVNDKEILYYFGVRTPKNNDIFLRFILKVNEEYFNSLEKFFEYNDIAFEVKIKNNSGNVQRFLKTKFDFIFNNDDKRYFIRLGKINSSKFMLNLRNLIKLVEFDLDVNNDILIINDVVEFKRKNKSPKINDNRKISQSNEKNQIKSISNTSVKKNHSKIKKNAFSKQYNREIKTISKDKNMLKKSSNENHLNDTISEKIKVDMVKKDQVNNYSEILEAIKEGYKFIIVESNNEKSNLIRLAENYHDSLILTSNEYSKNNLIKDLKLMNNPNIDVYEYDDFAKNSDMSSNSKKWNLLILDEAHRIEEKIVNYISYDIDLSDYDYDFINDFTGNIKKLNKKDYKTWLEFIKYLSLENSKITQIKEYIKENPQNWICGYDEFYNSVSFQPLDISNFVKKYYFDKADVCIFISSSIMDYKMFSNELGLDISDVKLIHNELPFDSSKTKIYTRNSFDMSKKYFDEISDYFIDVINEILKTHKDERGIIYTYNSSLRDFILKNIEDNRLISYSNNNFDFKIKSFKNSKNNVLVGDLIDSFEFPNDYCRFQIIVKQPISLLDLRAKTINKSKSNWYDYKTAINIVQLLQRAVKSTDDFCVNYMLDEKFLMFISNDITKNKYIPENILNKIVDFDKEDHKMISNQINKQFGIYYLYDYLPKTRKIHKAKKYSLLTKRISEKIRNYKKYNKRYPNLLKEDFDFFNKKLIDSIIEFSKIVIGDEINKIALVAVPSSTIERDNSATIRDSIEIIEKCYNSNHELKKEIINCSELLYRSSNVKPSHLKGRRPSYIEHKKSIKCSESKILNMNNIAFIILDDISTRGTILNACEDILIENGVNQENIYKLVIGKTVGFDD